MMTLWLIFAGLALLIVTLLVLPLVRVPRPQPSRVAFDMQVYREQLAELDRDRERGVLPADQAEAARTEIYRRMLAAEAAEPETEQSGRRPGHLLLALALVVGLPLIGGLIYLRLGAPGLAGKPFVGRQSDTALQMAGLTDKLAARLATTPDGEGFRRLGEAYMAEQRYDDAVRAFQRAQSLGVADAALLSGLGEAVAMLDDGMVGPEARQLFLQALAKDVGNPQARFYLGLAEAQIGDFRKAVAIWRDLENSAGAGAPWLDAVRQQIADAASQGGFDPASVTPAPPSAR